MKNVFVHDQVKIVIDAPDGMTRRDMLESLIQEILRSHVRENGIEVTAKFWNAVQSIVSRVEMQVAPKPEPAAKPNRLRTWAVRRSRSFWWACGVWTALTVQTVAYEIIGWLG